MDKKKIIKTVSAVCFVVVCGAVCVWMHYGKQKTEHIVWEQKVAAGDSRNEEMSSAAADNDSDGDPEEGTQSDRVSESTVDDTVQPEDREQPEEPQAMEPQLVICVHLCGAVTAEGVYRLPEGSRLIDGVTAAGGFLTTADTSYHNLAARLSDGQKVYIPTKEETKDVSVEERTVLSEGTDPEKTGLKPGNAAPAKVNINTAGVEELTTLSGIGESKAKSIIQYREKVGAFQRIEELKNVSGIGDAMFERVKEEITVE